MNIIYFSLGFFSLFMFVLGFLFDRLQKEYQAKNENISFNNSFSEIEILSENQEWK